MASKQKPADNGTKLGKQTFAAKAVIDATAAMDSTLRDTAASITNSMMMAMRKEAMKMGVGSAFYGETADGEMREMVFGKVYSSLLEDATVKLNGLAANVKPI